MLEIDPPPLAVFVALAAALAHAVARAERLSEGEAVVEREGLEELDAEWEAALVALRVAMEALSTGVEVEVGQGEPEAESAAEGEEATLNENVPVEEDSGEREGEGRGDAEVVGKGDFEGEGAAEVDRDIATLPEGMRLGEELELSVVEVEGERDMEGEEDKELCADGERVGRMTVTVGVPDGGGEREDVREGEGDPDPEGEEVEEREAVRVAVPPPEALVLPEKEGECDAVALGALLREGRPLLAVPAAETDPDLLDVGVADGQREAEGHPVVEGDAEELRELLGVLLCFGEVLGLAVPLPEETSECVG